MSAKGRRETSETGTFSPLYEYLDNLTRQVAGPTRFSVSLMNSMYASEDAKKWDGKR